MNWLSRRETVALGWTLLHFLWQGAALAAAYAIVDRMTRGTSVALRYLVALGVFALMPLAVIATFANEMRANATNQITPSHSPLHSKTISLLDFDAQQSNTAPDQRAEASQTGTRQAWLASHLEPALPWVDDVWMIGISLLALRAMGGWWHLQQLRRRARWFVPVEIEDQFRHICHRMKLGRQISLRISEEVLSPLAMGIWRATVILPVSALIRMKPSELEAVLAHELGHIRRLDYLCNLFQTAVESVLFFHPAVWWLSRTVRERREICCDEIAVSVCDDPVIYAEALLHLEEEKSERLNLAVALRGQKGSLLHRVRLVLGETGMAESRATGGVRFAAAALLVTGLLFGPKVSQVVAAPSIGSPQTASTPPAPAELPSPQPQPKATPVEAAPTPKSQPNPAPPPAPVAAPAPAVAPLPAPVAAPAPAVAPLPAVNVRVQVDAEPNPSSEFIVSDEVASVAISQIVADQSSQAAKASQAAARAISVADSRYIEQMRSAGYPLDLSNDLGTLIALKSLGVTPDYARAMNTTGLGKPSAHDLIALKSLGITPEYLSSLQRNGLDPKDLHQAVALHSMGITPEYASAMKQAGYTDLDAGKLMSLKAVGMTPEQAKWLKQQFPQATTNELQRAAIFHIDEKFMAQARSHGFNGNDLDKLVKLKITGLLDE